MKTLEDFKTNTFISTFSEQEVKDKYYTELTKGNTSKGFEQYLEENYIEVGKDRLVYTGEHEDTLVTFSLPKKGA